MKHQLLVFQTAQIESPHNSRCIDIRRVEHPFVLHIVAAQIIYED